MTHLVQIGNVWGGPLVGAPHIVWTGTMSWTCVVAALDVMHRRDVWGVSTRVPSP